MAYINKLSLAAGRKAKLGVISRQDASYIEKQLLNAPKEPEVAEKRKRSDDIIDEESFGGGSKKSKSKSTSMAVLSELVNGDPLTAEEMKLSGKELESLPDLGKCTALRRLDVSNNKLESLEFMSQCRDLTWLSINGNQVQDITHLKQMWHLQMLNLGGNKIEMLNALEKMKDLKALIANKNAIRSFEGLGFLVNISTLVLSHNSITEISGIKNLRNLTKLSVAHNQIRLIPDLSSHPLLEELRLNDNRIMRIPDTIDRNPELRLLDLGRNRLFDINDVKKLSSCRKLHNLNLFGNAKLCELPEYREKAIASIPHLVILDSRRVDECKAPKKKKAALDPSRSKKDPNKLPASADADQVGGNGDGHAAGKQLRKERDPKPPRGDEAASAQKSKEEHAGTAAHNEFVKQEIRRLRAADPTLDHRAAFKLAAIEWHKLHPRIDHESPPGRKGDDLEAGSGKKKKKGVHEGEVGKAEAEEEVPKQSKRGAPQHDDPSKPSKSSNPSQPAKTAKPIDSKPQPRPAASKGAVREQGGAAKEAKVVEVRDGWESTNGQPIAPRPSATPTQQPAPAQDEPGGAPEGEEEARPSAASSGLVAIRVLSDGKAQSKPVGIKASLGGERQAGVEPLSAALSAGIMVGLGGASAWD